MTTWPSELVEPEWLAEHLEDARVRIVDCRFSLADVDHGRRAYLNGHIPGAVHADLERDLSGPIGPETGRHPLPDPRAFGRRLAAWGIDSKDTGSPTFVVAYDDTGLVFAARLWWMLEYVGHRHVAVLNGTWSAWQRLGLPISREVPRPAPGRFTPRPRSDRVVSHADVRASLGRPNVALIDARSPQRHQGIAEPIDPVAGTIPGALNYFSDDVVDEGGRLKPADWLAEYWQSLDRAEESIAFCGSGVAACLDLLSQQVAERQPSKLYVGGWSEWCRRGARLR